MAKKKKRDKDKEVQHRVSLNQEDHELINDLSAMIVDDIKMSNKSYSLDLGQTITSNIINESDNLVFSVSPQLITSDDKFMLQHFQTLEETTSSLTKQRLELVEELRETQQELDEHKKDKEKLKQAKEKAERKFQDLQGINLKISKERALGSLLSQVNDEARKKLFESDEKFRALFESIQECMSYVLSIDIRRSTELMLKAKHPRLFEKFIVSLCKGLSEIILKNYGIFDKFTGDGILAFFPDFFSGNYAGLMAVKSAIECHQFFDQYYNKNRKCFTSVMKDVGLGIGIDCGNAHLVNMGGSYTVVGNPVVYACRMSGGNAEDTLLNQTAYENIFDKYKQFFNFEEKTINLKHEGNFLAYKVSSNGEPMIFKKPDWDSIIKNYKIKS